mgnify:CR=1 FL=1
MTNQQINERIAVICGWKKCACNDEHCGAWFPPGDFEPELGVPDYANDLNAMAEAAKTLAPEPFIRRKYIQTLDVITGDQWNTVDATARQRAEAFLRAHNQWEEA